MVFVLDDNEERLSTFRRMFFNSDVVTCSTFNDFVEKIGIAEYDKIYLDHDLEGLLADSDNENTGYQAAKYMAAKGLQKKARIVVHSWNPWGSKKMVDLLKANGYDVEAVPYGILVSTYGK